MTAEFVFMCVIDQNLDKQGVKNHSKMMVLTVSDGEWNPVTEMNQHESIQRTQKGFQILSERGDTKSSLF